MSCFFQQLSSRSTLILHRRLVGAAGFPVPNWKRIIASCSVRVELGPSAFARFRLRCYSSSSSSADAAVSVAPKRKARPRKARKSIDEEKEPFYVVRKGDMVGVYKTLSDCQAQVGASVCDPPASVFKGFSLGKDTEDYLLARGLRNALYTINACDLKEDLFGTLVPCSIQEPSSPTSEALKNDLPHAGGTETVIDGSIPVVMDPGGNQVKVDCLSADSSFCVLEFDGASKGNPGQAGAGAVLRADDGSLICKMHQGLGVATCNAAEYRAIILGLKSALERGYTSIRVQGDSKLVCMQLQGLWQVREENLCKLHAEATTLKEKFKSFEISHVLRASNSDADAQANLGIKLDDGQIEQDLLCNTHSPLN